MKTCIAVVLLLFGGICFAQNAPHAGRQTGEAYPESEAAAAWRALAAGYVRKALKDQRLDQDRSLNARVDAVMAAVGAAVAAIDPRYSNSTWKAILIEDFGYGAAAFPGETILVDASFVRKLQVNDDELALILSHEAAHLVAGHAAAKLSFMAEFLGKKKLPTARTALLEFLAKDDYAAAYRPTARLQEREADRIGAGIFFAAGYDGQVALRVFDKLALLEGGETERDPGWHDLATARKQAVSEALAELQRFHAGRQRTPQ
ncbi:MAG: M48 family metalloprotease [Burkholderiales bacterium]|nr:M48 family metalloprotease [Burkholderiales bacterium]